MLLLLAAGWGLAYGRILFLSFGGSRWTSDMAINYYKTVLGVAAQLMAVMVVLLIGIGKTFLDDYYNQMSKGVALKEIGVMLIVAVLLLILVTKIPKILLMRHLKALKSPSNCSFTTCKLRFFE